MEIYLDNSATTRVCTAAAEDMMRMLTENYGNASSQHFMGMNAFTALNKAREKIAFALGCDKDEVFFTPSGTVANNTAIFGAAELNRRKGNNIVTTSIEHPSVAEPIKKLESKGFKVTRIKADKSGNISENDLYKAINHNTILVSIMAVNNEVGSINPIQSIKNAVRAAASPALIHCDAVQAFGKIKLKPLQMGVDLLSVSSHKVHGPKGAGALFVRKGINLPAHILGGGQEKGLISGTEALPAIVGFATAVASLPEANAEYTRVQRLKEDFISKLGNIAAININSPHNAMPHIINISILGIPSEVIINFLSARNICVSAGSACKKGHRSEVLKAMGFPPKVTDSAIRISLSRYTTQAELDELYRCLYEAAGTLRRPG